MTGALKSKEPGVGAVFAPAAGSVTEYQSGQRRRHPGYRRDVERRTETQSIESGADPESVVALLAQPGGMPEWAPAFADMVTGEDRSGWRATKDGREFSLRVVVNREACTVDYLREVAPGREGGAYIRAVPRPGGGSVVIMTLPLLAGVDPAVTSATLRNELNALARLAEGS